VTRPATAITPAAITRPWKLLPILSLVVAFALVTAGILIASYLERSARADKISAVGGQARILASTVTAALSFHDRSAAQEYVNALRADPAVEAAAIYEADGSLFASFSRTGFADPPQFAPGVEHVSVGGSMIEGGHLVVTMPAAEGGSALGSVYLRTLIEPAALTWARYGIIALLGIMAAVVVALFGVAQMALRRANAELEAHAESLAEANRNLQTEIAEREKAEAALRQAQKMEAIGQLTGGIAHDFNNLLMVISGGIDMLGRFKDAERRQRVTDGMRQAVERGAALTRQLLTFSRRQPLKPEPIELARRIGDMVELLDHSLRGDIRVEMHFPADLWPVNVDPTQLELAMLNLAVNARDAMPDGGTLTVTAANRPGLDDGEIRGDFVGLSVTDTGTGMPPEILARVFEPFFTTKDIGKGSGLGLAQIYGFAQRSGGAVRIQSEVGRGTTVNLLMPRSDRPPAPARPAPEAKAARNARAAARQATVLLVEDDEEVAALAGDMIGQLGYEVSRVANAQAALGALANGRVVDVVFSDIMMPGGMNGADLAREIIRRRPDLPVVLTTGYDGQSAVSTDELGLPLLRKPYRLDALASALSTALGPGGQPAATPAGQAASVIKSA
jgi:signal transduction histidine kinase/ActR/RegA family two-component response regulator